MKKGEIAKTILKVVAESTILLAVVALPGAAPLLKMFNSTDERKRERIKRSLEILRKNKFVNIYYKGDIEVVEITREGKTRLLAYGFDDMKVAIPKVWDGLWRVIIFDIPENKKKFRNAFHIKLRELDFESIQKSTFVTPYDCRDIIDFLGEHFQIRHNIKYLVVKELEGSEELKKKFGIK
ncbi:MAG: hypothetical protein HQ402_01655 [Parcubacteria group bacterium]|nr:hypothetical protein [Parcubacteria group bacterium]